MSPKNFPHGHTHRHRRLHRAVRARSGFVFLFANLVLGWLVRPRLPNVEKLEVYECGEPTIGSSFVQFDLRFYVVALLFIIFDVEVAFFFPWATVFGKATQLAAGAAEPPPPATDSLRPAVAATRLQRTRCSAMSVAREIHAIARRAAQVGSRIWH